MLFHVFFFKQKTAYEMRISDWSSDVCSSDLRLAAAHRLGQGDRRVVGRAHDERLQQQLHRHLGAGAEPQLAGRLRGGPGGDRDLPVGRQVSLGERLERQVRSEEHTSELQSLMRTSYAVFCYTKKIHTYT